MKPLSCPLMWCDAAERKCFDLWVSAVNQLIFITVIMVLEFLCLNVACSVLMTAGTCCQLSQINSWFEFCFLFILLWGVKQMDAFIECDLNSHFSLFSQSRGVSVPASPSFNLISLLKLISLINICLCQDLEG